MIVYKVFRRISATELASMIWKMENMPQEPLLVYRPGELARPKPKCGALAAYKRLGDAMSMAVEHRGYGDMEVWKCYAVRSARRPRIDPDNFACPKGVLFSPHEDGTYLCTDLRGHYRCSVVPCARLTPLEKVWAPR